MTTKALLKLPCGSHDVSTRFPADAARRHAVQPNEAILLQGALMQVH